MIEILEKTLLYILLMRKYKSYVNDVVRQFFDKHLELINVKPCILGNRYWYLSFNISNLPFKLGFGLNERIYTNTEKSKIELFCIELLIPSKELYYYLFGVTSVLFGVHVFYNDKSIYELLNQSLTLDEIKYLNEETRYIEFNKSRNYHLPRP